MDQQEKDTILLIVVTTALIIFFVGLIINLLLYARNRKLKHLAEVQDIKLHFEKDLLSTRLEVTESTLEEVASDLHDDVGQMLTVAILELNRMEGANEAKAAVKAGLESVRTISKSLSPEYMKTIGLQASIVRMAERLSKNDGLQIELQLDEGIDSADQSRDLYIFRILQELVTNTLKYARATKIEINIWKMTEAMHIVYRDNGIGFSTSEVPENSGLGLVNVRRRVAVLNGTILIKSTPGNGFIAEMQFPMS